MGTNMTVNGGAERKLAELAEEVLRLQKLNTQPGAGQAVAAEPAAPEQPAPEPALAPLVDRIAHGFAKSLVMALKELEKHIAAETRKVGDTLERRLDALQTSISEQRSLTLSLRESETRQDAEIAALRSELSVQQEDIARRQVHAGRPLLALGQFARTARPAGRNPALHVRHLRPARDRTRAAC